MSSVTMLTSSPFFHSEVSKYLNTSDLCLLSRVSKSMQIMASTSWNLDKFHSLLNTTQRERILDISNDPNKLKELYLTSRDVNWSRVERMIASITTGSLVSCVCIALFRHIFDYFHGFTP